MSENEKKSSARLAKEAAVETLKEKFSKASTVVLVDFRGLTVAEDTALRNEFRKAGVEYTVIKNSMIHLATEQTPYGEQLKALLEGPTAVAFGYEDMIAPAKIAAEYGKKTKKLAIKGGACDGAYLDAAGVQALAELPSKEVLIARFMGSLMSAVSGFARLVEAYRKKLAGEE
jgi:large subunit ribosomal protein L10